MKKLGDVINRLKNTLLVMDMRHADCIAITRTDIVEMLELLKAQEPVKPLILVKDAALSNGAKYLCGECGGSFFRQKVNFCPWCGKAVNWE